jgi:hypothetical protein
VEEAQQHAGLVVGCNVTVALAGVPGQRSEQDRHRVRVGPCQPGSAGT